MSRAAFGESSVPPRLLELRKIAGEIFAQCFPEYTEVAVGQGVIEVDDWVRQSEVRVFTQKSHVAMNKKRKRASE